VKSSDDGFHVTSDYIRDQEWVAPTEEGAIRKARQSILKLHGERKLDTRPNWMLNDDFWKIR